MQGISPSTFLGGEGGSIPPVPPFGRNPGLYVSRQHIFWLIQKNTDSDSDSVSDSVSTILWNKYCTNYRYPKKGSSIQGQSPSPLLFLISRPVLPLDEENVGKEKATIYFRKDS